METEIANIVRAHGWFAASISDNVPPFLYTIGLMQSGDHPELVIFGLGPDKAHGLVSAMIRGVRNGESYRQPGIYAGVSSGDHPIGIRHVDPTQHPLFLGYAMGYCRYIGRGGELQAVQVFWPDEFGKFPFEVGCDLEVFRSQPRLDFALTASEIEEFARPWE